MKIERLKIFVVIGVFSSLSIILQQISFPIIPAAPYLKLEFSSIPMITLAIYYGIRYGFLSALVVNIVDAITKSSLTGYPLDQCINLLSITLFMVIITYFLKKEQYIHSFIIPVLLNVVVLTLLNYWFITPLYFSLAQLPLPANFLMWSIKIYGVFNMIKWGIIALVYIILYQRYFKKLKNQIG